jgi:hypothetical protein
MLELPIGRQLRIVAVQANGLAAVGQQPISRTPVLKKQKDLSVDVAGTGRKRLDVPALVEP